MPPTGLLLKLMSIPCSPAMSCSLNPRPHLPQLSLHCTAGETLAAYTYRPMRAVVMTAL